MIELASVERCCDGSVFPSYLQNELLQAPKVTRLHFNMETEVTKARISRGVLADNTEKAIARLKECLEGLQAGQKNLQEQTVESREISRED